MIRYKIAVKDNAFALQQEVNSLLSEGWELAGGIAMTQDTNGTKSFAQALTKQSADQS